MIIATCKFIESCALLECPEPDECGAPDESTCVFYRAFMALKKLRAQAKAGDLGATIWLEKTRLDISDKQAESAPSGLEDIPDDELNRRAIEALRQLAEAAE